VGDNVTIGTASQAGQAVQIGDNVVIGANVVIKQGATIGVGAQIGDGAVIGQNSSIGAGAIDWCRCDAWAEGDPGSWRECRCGGSDPCVHHGQLTVSTGEGTPRRAFSSRAVGRSADVLRRRFADDTPSIRPLCTLHRT
jgi:hypothetical protein